MSGRPATGRGGPHAAQRTVRVKYPGTALASARPRLSSTALDHSGRKDLGRQV